MLYVMAVGILGSRYLLDSFCGGFNVGYNLVDTSHGDDLLGAKDKPRDPVSAPISIY